MTMIATPGDAIGTSRTEPPIPPIQSGEPDELIIRPRKGWVPLDFKELWNYRELLYFMIWRDVKVRYKQTMLGVAWAVMTPTFQMIIFTVIFGRWANMGTDSVNGQPLPYPVWVYAALLPWTYISNAFTVAGLSLLNQQHMLTKIYFPRLFVPFAVIVGGMVDMLISLIVFGALMAFYQVVPSWQIIFLPLLLLVTIATSAGISLILAAVTLTYRDFRYVIPFLVQAMMYLSAVVFPMSKVPEVWQPIAAINPIFGLIDAYRTILLGTPWHPTVLAISLAVNAGLLTLGLYYFKRTERRFADIA